MSAPNFNSAPALSRPTPENDEPRGQAGFIRNQETGEIDGHCAQPAPSDQALKADATRIARAALAGIELVRLGDGTWLAHKWGMFRPLATDEDADAWLRRVGAPG